MQRRMTRVGEPHTYHNLVLLPIPPATNYKSLKRLVLKWTNFLCSTSAVPTRKLCTQRSITSPIQEDCVRNNYISNYIQRYKFNKTPHTYNNPSRMRRRIQVLLINTSNTFDCSKFQNPCAQLRTWYSGSLECQEFVTTYLWLYFKLNLGATCFREISTQSPPISTQLSTPA